MVSREPCPSRSESTSSPRRCKGSSRRQEERTEQSARVASVDVPRRDVDLLRIGFGGVPFASLAAASIHRNTARPPEFAVGASPALLEVKSGAFIARDP